MSRLALALLLCACNTPRSQGEAPPGIVEVLADAAVVKSGGIGVKERQDATYVLVDARNLSAEHRMVAIDGTLVDGAGQAIGPLALDELRVPAGETRTFALVHGGVAPTAAGARFRVRRAAPLDHAPPVVVAPPTIEPEGEGIAAVCRVENTLDRSAVVTLIAAFHDGAGRITGRPFVLLELQPHSSRPFRFTGPPGSTTAKVYVGDVTY